MGLGWAGSKLDGQMDGQVAASIGRRLCRLPLRPFKDPTAGDELGDRVLKHHPRERPALVPWLTNNADMGGAARPAAAPSATS